MPNLDTKPSYRKVDPGLHDRLRVLIYTRLVFISILLAATIFIGLKEEAILGVSIVFIFIMIGATILVSLIFAIFLFSIRKDRFDLLKLLSYIQIFWDIFFATAVVYITGGVDSIFYILYYVNIVLSSILLFRKGGFLAASFSSIGYGIILVFEVHGILPQFFDLNFSFMAINETHVLAKMVVNVLFFFFLAWISSRVAERLKRTEELLEEKKIDIKNLENFNRAIVESLNSGLLTLDKDDYIISLNDSALKILELRSSEIVGRRLEDIFPVIGKKILKEYGSNGGAHHSLYRWESSVSLPNQKNIFVGMNVVPFKIKDLLEGGKIVVFEDLTIFKEMEDKVKKTEKLAAVGEMAAGIAHEIRNPLTSMSGAIEMLKQNSVEVEGREKLMDIVLRETTRLNYLISDFLNFAKTPKVSKEVFNINELIDETVELFMKNRSDWNGTFIEKELKGNVYISADPQQMKQVIWNLLKNAAQAMTANGRIRIETEADSSLSELLLSIKDNGAGISPEDLGKIFSPFFTTKKGGTGLGLATVQKIIEEHGGRITVESEPGAGSEFKIFLPLQ